MYVYTQKHDRDELRPFSPRKNTYPHSCTHTVLSTIYSLNTDFEDVHFMNRFFPPPGGFSCSCPSGLSFDGSTCVDIDECAEDAGRCGQGGRCVNTEGQQPDSAQRLIMRNAYFQNTEQNLLPIFSLITIKCYMIYLITCISRVSLLVFSVGYGTNVLAPLI